MENIIPNYNDVNILVIGDVMLDRYWYGATDRISPESPVPVVKVNNNEDRPGGAANVAMNISSLGGNSHLVGIVGNDEPAQALRSALGVLNVHCDFVIANVPTITKLRVLSRGQQLIRLDFEEQMHHIDVGTILSLVKTALTDKKAVILSDYAKGTLEHSQAFIQEAIKLNIPVFVDPKGADFERYRGATLLTPNMLEFKAVVGEIKTDKELVEKGQALIQQFDFEALLVTRSEHGMSLLRRNIEPLHLPILAKDVFDVTGAGDTVISVLAASVASGKTLEEACFLANTAAGIVVGKLGTSSVSAIELAKVIDNQAENDYGVLTEHELLKNIQLSKAKGEKIVMTNGCFDILHAGHVSYLKKAAKLGDRLIVAVNTNESVQRLKGVGRPINSVDRRMAVLSGLGAVDWVVAFEDDTPQSLISKILPDVLVKGGDYTVNQIAGADDVMLNGGEVTVLNYEEGCSTTSIINNINKLSRES
tara:strand:- start:4729 stop:6162 length:1434 start_codon:yes stop_codon:yes gene_type:complete